MTDKDKPTQYQRAGKILHDIATPMLIAQINTDLLLEHLPALIAAFDREFPQAISTKSEAEAIDSLMNAPVAIKNNLKIVRENLNALTNLIEEANKIGKNALTVPAAKIPLTFTEKIHRILLVDDETIYQDLGINLLSNYFDIDVASNGFDAIKRCKEKHYDLILMDLQMPKMNGIEATKEIRKQVEAHTLIFGLTNMPIGEKHTELLSLGFDNFLEKPLKLESFQNILRLHCVNDYDASQ